MKKSIKITAVILTAAILIAGAIVAVNRFSDKTDSDNIVTTSETQTSEAVPAADNILNPEDIEWNGDDFEALNNDGLVNILLIGQDKREGESRQRSDAMILCSFNPETNRLSMISFLRDLYVQIPGYEDNRLNAAFAYGGFDLLKETLSLNFGITVDGCLESDFEGFEKIIDTVGGVEIELTAEEAAIVGGGAAEGLCTLNGEQALTYARIRKIDSDFQRTARQRKIMGAVFEKAKTYTLPELAMFFNEILPLMATDMTEDEIMTLALTLASSFSEIEISSCIVPAEGTYKNATVRGMAVLVPDLYKIKKLIFEEYLPM
ncbi:MAG: LCP family protein [Clostridia bacterium]|nr:LCP family protein [Clostridia bacterium]